MESEKVLNDLLGEDKILVTAALEEIKKSMDSNDGALMIGNIKKLYRGFYNVLASHSFDPVHQWTNLLIEILKNNDPDTEIYFSRLVPILVQNLGSTKIPICTATFNCLKAYERKLGGLSSSQIKPNIIINNLHLGIEGSKTNVQNIKEYLDKLQGKEPVKSNEYDQLEKELLKQTPSAGKF